MQFNKQPDLRFFQAFTAVRMVGNVGIYHRPEYDSPLFAITALLVRRFNHHRIL